MLARALLHPGVSWHGTFQECPSRQVPPLSFSAKLSSETRNSFRSTKPERLMVPRAPRQGPREPRASGGACAREGTVCVCVGGSPAKHRGLWRAADPSNHPVHCRAKALRGRRAGATAMGRCCECPHSRPNEKAGDCSRCSSSHDAGEAVPTATGCRRGWELGPFHLLPGEKGAARRPAPPRAGERSRLGAQRQG